jgi:hypothetical protein
MATVQVSDGATALGSTVVNDGGVVVNGGNIQADNPMTVSKSLATMADSGTGYGAVVVAKNGGSAADGAGVQTAYAAGAGGLAYFPSEGQFILKGAGDTSAQLNNSASSIVSTPASEVRLRAVNTVHKVVDTKLHGAYSDAEFNVLAAPSPAFVPGRTKGSNAGADSNFVQTGDGATAATDDAASSTRAVPGELTYHFGGLAAPTTDEYKARDSYEA